MMGGLGLASRGGSRGSCVFLVMFYVWGSAAATGGTKTGVRIRDVCCLNSTLKGSGYGTWLDWLSN